MRRLAWIVAALALLTGCESFQLSQAGLFTDEDGNLAYVEYGRLKKEHETEFLSPVNGKKLTMKSFLAVKVDLNHQTLPEFSGSFEAYQCMNMLRTGTMYKSSNDKWLFHANGTSCSIYAWDKRLNDYRHVFNGLITQGMSSGGGQ